MMKPGTKEASAEMGSVSEVPAPAPVVKLTIVGSREDSLLDRITGTMVPGSPLYVHRSSFTDASRLDDCIHELVFQHGSEAQGSIGRVDIIGHAHGTDGVLMGDGPPAIRLDEAGQLVGEPSLRVVLEQCTETVEVHLLICQATQLRRALKQKLHRVVTEVRPKGALYLTEQPVGVKDFGPDGFKGVTARYPAP